VLPNPLLDAVDGDDVVGIGADLAPGTMLEAYRHGMFGMHLDIDGTDVLAWWSPEQRGVIPLDRLRVTRSLERSARQFEVRFDTAFDAVVQACRHGVRPGDRDGEWINDEYVASYAQLHELGWAHSVEAWRDGRLAGGLVCIEIGGLVCGESMFSSESDASKVALLSLVRVLRSAPGDPLLPGGRLLDVQWATAHLESLGAIVVERERYLRDLLPRALALPPALCGVPQLPGERTA
jgi:leucyl/phenylalanyl-tRNA---protein transferase